MRKALLRLVAYHHTIMRAYDKKVHWRGDFMPQKSAQQHKKPKRWKIRAKLGSHYQICDEMGPCICKIQTSCARIDHSWNIIEFKEVLFIELAEVHDWSMYP